MADAAKVFTSSGVAPHAPEHSSLVRITHWLTALSFFALCLTGVEILISHPRFYWGETGNVMMQPLFSIPIPASRESVPTGYGYVLPDQNGWSRSLHFQAAWLAVLTGLLYVISGMRSARLLGNPGYNPLQRATYWVVVLLLFPIMIWTGLAMSPALVSAYPFLVTAVGGQQSARTIHLIAFLLLVAFVVGHVFMVYRAGFKERVSAMIVGSRGHA